VKRRPEGKRGKDLYRKARRLKRAGEFTTSKQRVAALVALKVKHERSR
jgi:hypothetical protein